MSLMDSALQIAVNKVIVGRKFTVSREGRDLRLIKMVGKRPVSVFLKRMEGASFWIENPAREDHCVNSFLDYANTPTRVTRNKDVIGLVVKHLKETSLWDFIENKDFFKVNEHNHKAKKKVMESLFKQLRNG
jgi:hypothetical protein